MNVLLFVLNWIIKSIPKKFTCKKKEKYEDGIATKNCLTLPHLPLVFIYTSDIYLYFIRDITYNGGQKLSRQLRKIVLFLVATSILWG